MLGDIHVAVAGVGNCCSALLQGLEYYRVNGSKLGLLNPSVGGYGVGEITVVAAFDIDRNKIGRDLSDAIHAEPNKAPKFMDVGDQGVEVQMGPAPDAFGPDTMSKTLNTGSAAPARRASAGAPLTVVGGRLGQRSRSRPHRQQSLQRGP